MLTVVGFFGFSWGNVAHRAVESAVVVPVDVFEGAQLDLVQAPLGAASADELGLEQPDHRLGHGVVVGVAHRSSFQLPSGG